MKYFVIGFNKCGTSTFHNIFIENGIKSTHSTKWHLVLDEYDAFSDNGNLNDYKTLLNKFPNENFILNIRNLRSWLISRFCHGWTEVNPKTAPWANPVSIEKCKRWATARKKYEQEVVDHFHEIKKELYIADIDQQDWVQSFCAQFNLKTPHQNHHNKTKKFITNTELYKKIVNTVDQYMNHENS